MMNLPISAIVFLLFVLFSKSCLCVDKQYLACAPLTCGSNTISYPFYIESRQEAYCGFQGFNLSCDSRNQTILDLFGSNYTVHDIFYHNLSLRVSNAGFSDDCSLPTQNLNLYGNRFQFKSTNLINMFFFSSCNRSGGLWEDYQVRGCPPTAVAIMEKDLEKIDLESRNCGKNVSVRVELYGDEIGDEAEEDMWGKYYEKVARRGVVLNYTATSCSTCSESGGRCGYDSNQFQCFCKDKPHLVRCKSSHTRLTLALGIGLPLMALVCAVFGILLYRYKRRYASSEYFSRNSSDPNSRSYLDRGGAYFGVPVFSYCELQEATHHFDAKKEIGDGGFGTVYYGILKDGREVAVKRLYESNYKRVEQFMNEIQILTGLRHKNLVTLYGCTSRHSRELLLVYEYIPNGTVADHLHGDRASPSLLTWPIRMSIAIETANALSYLHASDIIHRDVKTNNILLDSNFCVKVADFGLSRLFPMDVTHVSTAPQGTPGYVDPEYHQCYQLTSKSDVYSFGVVLVELISSLAAVDISRHRHEINLSNLAINKIQSRAYNELVDPSLGFESDLKTERMITDVAELAFQCLQNDKDMRPAMDEVLETLKGIESGTFGRRAKVDVDDHPGMLNSSVMPPPSPESDEVVLLSNKMQPPYSPLSVTDKWIISTVTTPNTSS